jgi:hypothetical protein
MLIQNFCKDSFLGLVFQFQHGSGRYTFFYKSVFPQHELTLYGNVPLFSKAKQAGCIFLQDSRNYIAIFDSQE